MKDKNIHDKEKLLTALMSDEFDDNESFKSGKKLREKDSLLMDSVKYNNQNYTTQKELRNEDSFNAGRFSSEASKVNMTDDLGRYSLLENDKKKQVKDKKFLNKLVDHPSTSHKKLRPKSSKGIRSNHSKVNTMSNVEVNTTKNKKRVTNYLNTNGPGNRIANKHSGRKKHQNFQNVRPSSSKNDNIR